MSSVGASTASLEYLGAQWFPSPGTYTPTVLREGSIFYNYPSSPHSPPPCPRGEGYKKTRARKERNWLCVCTKQPQFCNLNNNFFKKKITLRSWSHSRSELLPLQRLKLRSKYLLKVGTLNFEHHIADFDVFFWMSIWFVSWQVSLHLH